MVYIIYICQVDDVVCNVVCKRFKAQKLRQCVLKTLELYANKFIKLNMDTVTTFK